MQGFTQANAQALQTSGHNKTACAVGFNPHTTDRRMAAEDNPRDFASPPFRLMIGADVAPADAARATAFLSLGSGRLQRAWSVATDAPAGGIHAMLSGLDDPPTIPSALGEPVVHLRLSPAGRAAPEGTLRSPLQFDELIEALVGAEASWDHEAARAQRAVAATIPGDFSDTLADAALADESAPVPAPAHSWAGMRFRLRRWPPTALLQSSRYGVRLASFMSARFISLDELEQLSNVARAECAAVVLGFMDQALLHVRREGEVPAAAEPVATADAAASAAPTAPAAVTAPAAPVVRIAANPPRSGLLSALRRRFGLAAGR